MCSASEEILGKGNNPLLRGHFELNGGRCASMVIEEVLAQYLCQTSISGLPYVKDKDVSLETVIISIILLSFFVTCCSVFSSCLVREHKVLRSRNIIKTFQLND